jgi:hypothetical protein
MTKSISRRRLIYTSIYASGFGLPLTQALAAPESPVSETFPMQPSEMVKEMVIVSHGKFDRVRELVEAHPALSKAAWDWGYGDWEAAIDAASHVGNRQIAEYLLTRGARPTLFSAAMLGQLDVVKAFIAANPGIQRCPGPHSISLLAHAKNGGPAAKDVYQYLESLGDAGTPSSAPLSEAELQKLAGSYSFGSGPRDRMEVKNERGQLSLTREGGIARGLVHLGENTFHPAGASAVRVIFTPTPDAVTLTVHDPVPVLTATKSN